MELVQPTTTTTPPSIPLPEPCEAMQIQIRKYTDWDANVMQAISQAENRTCDPLRHNLTNSEDHGVCIGSYGVLQVGCLHYNSGESRDDLETNVAVAHRVWLKQGYTAWTMYKNGTYKGYLK